MTLLVWAASRTCRGPNPQTNGCAYSLFLGICVLRKNRNKSDTTCTSGPTHALILALLVQAAHMYLCHAVLWDFDGLWQWLMAAKDAPVSAIACYGGDSQLQQVIAIQRQGIFFNHICLPGCGGALAQPLRDFTDQLTDSEYLLDCQIGIIRLNA